MLIVDFVNFMRQIILKAE